MKLVPITEAKANFSPLIKRVSEGEEVIIGRNGVPVARLVPYRIAEPKRRKAGLLRGKVWVADGFTGSANEIAEALRDEPAPKRRRKEKVKARRGST